MRIKIEIALLSLFLCFGCARVQEPVFRKITDFRVVRIGVNAVTVGLGMTYHNPNNFTVTVKETAVKVYLDSVVLGDFIQDTSIRVGENTDFTVPLSGTIPLRVFLKLNLKNIHKRAVRVTAEGETRIGKAGVFVTKKIAYSGEHRLD